MSSWKPPEIPASAGALLFDAKGRLLVLEPTYKDGWTIPGGAMEANGESPWDACRREVREETGLTVTRGRLVVVDTRPGKEGRKLGLRFLFDCGTLSDEQITSIRLQAKEIASQRFVGREKAIDLLSKPVGRRVALGWGADHCVYAENGHLLDGVRS